MPQLDPILLFTQSSLLVCFFLVFYFFFFRFTIFPFLFLNYKLNDFFFNKLRTYVWYNFFTLRTFRKLNIVAVTKKLAFINTLLLNLTFKHKY